jgi:hypothetical protein
MINQHLSRSQCQSVEECVTLTKQAQQPLKKKFFLFIIVAISITCYQRIHEVGKAVNTESPINNDYVFLTSHGNADDKPVYKRESNSLISD